MPGRDGGEGRDPLDARLVASRAPLPRKTGKDHPKQGKDPPKQGKDHPKQGKGALNKVKGGLNKVKGALNRGIQGILGSRVGGMGGALR